MVLLFFIYSFSVQVTLMHTSTEMTMKTLKVNIICRYISNLKFGIIRHQKSFDDIPHNRLMSKMVVMVKIETVQYVFFHKVQNNVPDNLQEQELVS